MKLSFIAVASASAFALTACSGADVAPDDPWSDYDIATPPEGLKDVLGAPFVPPERVCVPSESITNLPSDAPLEDGQVCAWQLFSGAAPSGLKFNQVASCTAPFSQGPSWFVKPSRVYQSSQELLKDTKYVAELDWVQAQIEATGCGCCHASNLGSGNTSGFDVSAPAVWTDTMTNSQLIMSTGLFEDHRYFGHIEATENHGFSRQDTLFPSTDPMRLRAFFQAEFDRRGGTDADRNEAQAQFDALFGAVKKAPTPCVSPIEGIEGGKIVWNGEGARQVLIMEENAPTPAFPPNLDRPAGTLWALYVDNSGTPVESGMLTVGDVPVGTRQMVPEDGSVPTLVPGTKYRLFVSRDIMVTRRANCTFTYQP